ncbi:hypothetical protein EYF80_028462 [Liparis tanakae]|uniref:Uncharacterized protein n=1 Tax=Liparis tanakae TaxID=230148 RepID=A0A4Z2H7X6_9TELE|nr:hypothetical protein EYF80_028462 [Liparis tanakae]
MISVENSCRQGSSIGGPRDEFGPQAALDWPPECAPLAAMPAETNVPEDQHPWAHPTAIRLSSLVFEYEGQKASEQQIRQSPAENDEPDICNEEAMTTGTGFDIGEKVAYESSDCCVVLTLMVSQCQNICTHPLTGGGGGGGRASKREREKER